MVAQKQLGDSREEEPAREKRDRGRLLGGVTLLAPGHPCPAQRAARRGWRRRSRRAAPGLLGNLPTLPPYARVAEDCTQSARKQPAAATDASL